MATKTVSQLSRESLDRIHAESLRILENVGVRVENAGCRDVLRQAGAKAIGQTDVLRLPAAMVAEALAQITGQFELVHPTGERFPVIGGPVRVGTRVKMPKVLDYGAAACRPPCRQDVIDLCRITNALAGAHFSVAIQYPSSDVPPAIDVADSLGLVFAVTGHLSMCAPGTVEDARTSLDLSMAAVGSDDLENDPGTWIAVNTTTPLVLGDREGSIILHAVGRHSPIDVEPMPVSGVATPATLAANLAVGNAEALFLSTLANAIWPGAKVIFSTCGSLMNMRSANLSMGNAESCLLAAGETALAHYYGLAAYKMGGYSDSQVPDVQAGIEKAMATLNLAQSDADLVIMGGPLNNAAHHSYEQVVIDHDIWEMAQRLSTEIVVDDDTLAHDIIAKVGPGGSFLGESHTRRHIQAGEHYYGGSFNHSGRAGEQYTMLARAHERVEEILARPFEYGAPPAAVRRIKDFVRDHAKSKGVAPPNWTE
jgi:trimethylamine---corrinoid protein Co-methyltransferase